MTRRAAVAKVQIARKELGLDEDTYRAMLERITGRTSSADCTDDQLGDVLDEMKAKGWTPKVVAGGRTAPRPRAAADHPSAKKARALWLSMWHLGEIEHPEETALEAFAKRQLGVDRLQWADQGQCYKLIEALKAMAERAGWSQDVSGLPRDIDRIKVLKVRLIRLQTSRLGHPAQCADYMNWPHPDLNHLTRSQGEQIRAAKGAG